jgi:serine/threonine protein kinase
MLAKNYNSRIIDFGFSEKFQSDSSLFYLRCGSPSIISSEILLGKPYKTKCAI